MRPARKKPRPRSQEWWEDEEAGLHTIFRYRRLWVMMILAISLVSLSPLVVMFGISYHSYQKAFGKEVKHPIRMLASNVSSSLDYFLEDRKAALDYIIHDKQFDELIDQKVLTRIFRNLRQTHSGFVDIGLIDADGDQRSYVGPYGLKDKNYKQQDWFKETLLRGTYISDVFMGYRQFPHFAIAVKSVNEEGAPYMLRATLNAEIFNSLQQKGGLRPSQDTFIINQRGILQTSSKTFGKILSKITIDVPPPVKEPSIREERDSRGRTHVIGYAYIKQSPFIYMTVEQRSTLMTSWFNLRNKLFVFLGISVVLIVIAVLTGTTYMVNRIREADDKRIALLHKVEYTSKMASIGRLAAGVAHEINNPLAIINEKAGLLKDLFTYTKDFPQQERFLKHVDPILDSVQRCARITRRLLGFAKHMDLRSEPIKLEFLLREVLDFMEKEFTYRDISIHFDIAEDVPVVESDRGRLQQVFLNIINNAFGAVDDGGRIDIVAAREGDKFVKVTIRDDGVGIPEEDLQNIFEPFFTTKEKHGTGLGLSITYGIVTKLGGHIDVESKLGEWTQFHVTLPIKPQTTGASNERHAGTIG